MRVILFMFRIVSTFAPQPMTIKFYITNNCNKLKRCKMLKGIHTYLYTCIHTCIGAFMAEPLQVPAYGAIRIFIVASVKRINVCMCLCVCLSRPIHYKYSPLIVYNCSFSRGNNITADAGGLSHHCFQLYFFFFYYYNNSFYIKCYLFLFCVMHFCRISHFYFALVFLATEQWGFRL